MRLDFRKGKSPGGIINKILKQKTPGGGNSLLIVTKDRNQVFMFFHRLSSSTDASPLVLDDAIFRCYMMRPTNATPI